MLTGPLDLFDSFSDGDLMVCSGQLSCYTAQYRSVVGQIGQSHCLASNHIWLENTLIIQKGSWSTQCKAPRVQDKPISLSLHHHASQLLWGVCALFFAKCWIVHCGQTSPPWSCLSKGHCSISLVVCSDADYAVLPFSFASGCTSRQAILFLVFF